MGSCLKRDINYYQFHREMQLNGFTEQSWIAIKVLINECVFTLQLYLGMWVGSSDSHGLKSTYNGPSTLCSLETPALWIVLDPSPQNFNDFLKTSQCAQTFWKMTPILCKVQGYSQSFTRRSQNNAPWPKNHGHLLLTQVTTLTDHCPTGADTGIHTLAMSTPL